MDDVMRRRKVWGTWEELILGGAVLRHGTGDWDLISSELRTRTAYPSYFTPEACRARYEDLQQRYTGCKYWYDELRERRVAELKRALEKSEESIGLLVSKLENIKAQSATCDPICYNSSQTESPPLQSPKTNTVNIKSIQKHGSKEEFEASAGSFTQDLENLETKPQPKLDSPEGKLEVPESCMVRKRRGKRKRKDGSWDVKEDFVEGENLGSSSGIRQGETSTSSGCVRSSSADAEGPQFDDLVGVFNSVTENQYAMVFRRRLDSQKRARYRKTIKQHMDLDTIRSRIANNCIKSTRELFKDLLLLANNALVFYSKRTREYQSAFTFRGILTKKYKELLTDSNSNNSSRPVSSSILCFPSMSTPVRPRSVRPRAPCKQPKLVVKFPVNTPMAGPHGYLKVSGNSVSSTQNPEVEGSKKSNVDFLGAGDPKTVKKGSGRTRRVGGGGRGGIQPLPPPRNCMHQKKTHQK